MKHVAIDQLVAAATGLPRPALDALIERMICHLDALDGDPDIEDDDPQYCEAGDDGFHPIIRNGVRYWHSDPATKKAEYEIDQRNMVTGPDLGRERFTTRVSD